ncbi:MAG: pentapeptide repeat-containing protein [Hyphomicrobiales bacterium]|nr:pentapeptide repeat-containing protein [Hyphomicrobiales bacterium]
MANPEHLELLRQGAHAWNAWRVKEPSIVPDLTKADLRRANLSAAYLSKANLMGANLRRANLDGTDLSAAYLSKANLQTAILRRANLDGADLAGADLFGAVLASANLVGANLHWSNLFGADLKGADLRRANLGGANLTMANLLGANLGGADLIQTQLVETNLIDATLTNCCIYGISAWGVKLGAGTIQQGLIITRHNEPAVTVDDLEVAQFVYLLLNNDKIRRVIDTVGKKGVLLLGRFTEGRMAVLERLREELRKRGYLPIVFNFDKPETKDFTETIRLLAGLSKFVVADVTNPKSAPLELQATVPEIMVPFQPIIEEGEEPFAMLKDLWIKHRDWVFDPVYYSSIDGLVASFDKEIIEPAEARFDQLVMRKAETMKGRHV